MNEKIELNAEWHDCKLSDFCDLTEIDYKIILKGLKELEDCLDIFKIEQEDYDLAKSKILARRHIVVNNSIINVTDA